MSYVRLQLYSVRNYYFINLAWFPQYFHFDYYHVTFLYLPSMILITLPSFSFTPGIVALVVLLIIPYGLMVSFNVNNDGFDHSD